MSNFKHIIISATKDGKTKTRLYKSLEPYYDIEEICRFYEFNKYGLSEVYNTALETYGYTFDYIHFIHDDVEILDNWKRIKDDIESRPTWMITGVAGASKIEINYPSLWNTMGDPKSFKGSLHHLTDDKMHYFSTPCGIRPAKTVLLDGVYMCVNTKLYIEHRIKFDEQFKFHHYDLDISLQAVKAGFDIGVGNFNIAHESHGLTSLNDKNWQESNDLFLKKWKK